MKKSKLSNLIFVLSIIFLISVLFLKIYSQNNIHFFGITILKVSSDSMFPIFQKGDYIIIKKQDNYEVGDIITYNSKENYLITHRIIEKYENVFITKGDNNNVIDEEKVIKENILGKVICSF